VLDKVLELYYFISLFVRPLIPNGGTPLDDFLGLKQSLIYKHFQIDIGALTFSPTVPNGGDGLEFLPFPLGDAFLAHQS
jgi:hypothetical protein